MRIKTLKMAELSMDYCQFGKGEKTLVILPGISIQRVMKSAAAIEDAYDLLAEQFTIYVFERRNDMPSTYTVDDMARDTAIAIRALELGAVYVFGASQGGMIAMKLATGNPELVRKLILGSTSLQVTQQEKQVFENWIHLAEAGDKEKLCLAFGKVIYPRQIFEQARNALIEMSDAITAEDLDRFVILAKGMLNHDVMNEIGQVSCPVLVIGDKEDSVMGGESSIRIAECLNCDLYMYDGYGHAAYDLAPDYKERMLRFLMRE